MESHTTVEFGDVDPIGCSTFVAVLLPGSGVEWKWKWRSGSAAKGFHCAETGISECGGTCAKVRASKPY